MAQERILNSQTAQRILLEAGDPAALTDDQLDLVLKAQRKLAKDDPSLAVGQAYRTGENAAAEAWKRVLQREQAEL